MNISGVPFSITDWGGIEPVEFRRGSGATFERTVERGNIRLRIIEYHPGFESGHWCERGHVAFVLTGSLTVELKDGRTFTLMSGMSFQVANGDGWHRVTSQEGASIFVVD